MVSRQDLVSALDSVSYDKNVVLEMIDKHPDMIKMLSETKDNLSIFHYICVFLIICHQFMICDG